jgi:hypothetical protein
MPPAACRVKFGEGRRVTKEEYEQKQQELSEQAEVARKAYLDAKGVYDKICDQMRNLRIEFREQQKADRGVH